jgi:3-hydroxybutyryl-CoA dehydratase
MPALSIGQKAAVSRRFTADEVTALAKLVSEADRPGLAPTVPTALLGGLFSYLLGTQLPGAGTIYLKQQLEFIAPAYCDEELTATVEIREIKPEKRLVTLNTKCVDSQGQLICQGSALVLANWE